MEIVLIVLAAGLVLMGVWCMALATAALIVVLRRAPDATGLGMVRDMLDAVLRHRAATRPQPQPTWSYRVDETVVPTNEPSPDESEKTGTF